jgi:ATP-dependent DNA ligase
MRYYRSKDFKCSLWAVDSGGPLWSPGDGKPGRRKLYSRSCPFRSASPCLPTKAPQPPTGDTWLHEIKHGGFRVVARKDGGRVRRPGNDLT